MSDGSNTAFVSITVLANVDPLAAASDAFAQVIEHELRHRLTDLHVAISFCSTATPSALRRRTRWRPASRLHSHGVPIIDIGLTQPPHEAATHHVPLPDVTGWFPGILNPAALETRTLMLRHLAITAPEDHPGLTATDHYALGTLELPEVSHSTAATATAALDQIAENVRGLVDNEATHQQLTARIADLETRLDDAQVERAAWEHATTLELDRRDAEIRMLTQRLNEPPRP